MTDYAYAVLEVLNREYLPAISYLRDRYARLNTHRGYIAGGLNLFCDLLDYKMDADTYSALIWFNDAIEQEDGHSWLVNTLGLNINTYRLLKLRYMYLHAVRDYKAVHKALPEDSMQYVFHVLTSEFPDAECRKSF